MVSFEMKLCVKDVRLIVRAESPQRNLAGTYPAEALRVCSVRVAHADAELVGLIDGETLNHIEHAMRQWSGVKARLTPAAAAPREGVTHG